MPKKNTITTTQEMASLPASFEAAMEELSELVKQMEAGDLALEKSVIAYRRGSELIRYCANQLDKIEQQVKVLETGILKPFNVDNDEDLA
ncbi:exodeoxyribonuclease VII small subunit [Undibacterium sp. SXout11W]|uniref:exodeoxyribonuclease VII small subunit n=1 Tax=Undibacterium sp. SXout11W TaxID=3413050 RepID=UPI003BF3FDFF